MLEDEGANAGSGVEWTSYCKYFLSQGESGDHHGSPSESLPIFRIPFSQTSQVALADEESGFMKSAMALVSSFSRKTYRRNNSFRPIRACHDGARLPAHRPVIVD